jgi:hypothetical protein
MKTHMNICPYNFAFNFITFHVCPYKYLYKHIHQYLFALSIQNGRLRGIAGMFWLLCLSVYWVRPYNSFFRVSRVKFQGVPITNKGLWSKSDSSLILAGSGEKKLQRQYELGLWPFSYTESSHPWTQANGPFAGGQSLPPICTKNNEILFLEILWLLIWLICLINYRPNKTTHLNHKKFAKLKNKDYNALFFRPYLHGSKTWKINT